MKLFCLCCRNADGSARALVGAIKADDYVSVRGALQEQVSGYGPGERIVDLLHSARSTATAG
ncbi:MAG: hypothetical protein PHD19_12025 [Dechloromonas sp.]|nr:hypothetical protein [Dechloromonas sp.]